MTKTLGLQATVLTLCCVVSGSLSAQSPFSWTRTLEAPQGPLSIARFSKDPSLAPLADGNMLLTAEFQDGVSVAKIAGASGQVLWRTPLGIGFPLGTSVLADGSSLTLLASSLTGSLDSNRLLLFTVSPSGGISSVRPLDVAQSRLESGSHLTGGVVNGTSILVVRRGSSAGCGSIAYHFDASAQLLSAQGLSFCKLSGAQFGGGGRTILDGSFSPQSFEAVRIEARGGISWQRTSSESYSVAVDPNGATWIFTRNGAAAKVLANGITAFSIQLPPGQGGLNLDRRVAFDESGGALVYESRSVSRVFIRISPTGVVRWVIPAPDLPNGPHVFNGGKWLISFGSTIRELDDSGVPSAVNITLPAEVAQIVSGQVPFVVTSSFGGKQIFRLVNGAPISLDFGQGIGARTLGAARGAVAGVGVDVHLYDGNNVPAVFGAGANPKTLARLSAADGSTLRSITVDPNLGNVPSVYGGGASARVGAGPLASPALGTRLFTRFKSQLDVLSQQILPIQFGITSGGTGAVEAFVLSSDRSLFSNRTEQVKSDDGELVAHSWRIDRTPLGGASQTISAGNLPACNCPISNWVENGSSMYFSSRASIWRVQGSTLSSMFSVPTDLNSQHLTVSTTGSAFLVSGRSSFSRRGPGLNFDVAGANTPGRQAIGLLGDDGRAVVVQFPQPAFGARPGPLTITTVSAAGGVVTQTPYGQDPIAVLDQAFVQTSPSRAWIFALRYAGGVPKGSLLLVDANHPQALDIPAARLGHVLNRFVYSAGDDAGTLYLTQSAGLRTRVSRYEANRAIPTLAGSASVQSGPATSVVLIAGQVSGDEPVIGTLAGGFETQTCVVVGSNCTINTATIGEVVPSLAFSGDVRNLDLDKLLDPILIAGQTDLSIRFIPGVIRAQSASAGLTYIIEVRNMGARRVAGVRISHVIPGSASYLSCSASADSECAIATSIGGSLNEQRLALAAGGRIALAINTTIPLTEDPMTIQAAIGLPALVNDSNPADNTATTNYALGIFASGFE